MLTVCAREGGGSSACRSPISAWDAYCKCERYQGVSRQDGSCIGPRTPASVAPPPDEENGNFFSALPGGIRGGLFGVAAGALVGSLSQGGRGEKTRHDGRRWRRHGGTAAGAALEALVSPSSNPVVLGAVAAGGAYVAAKAIGEEREAQNLQTAEDTRQQVGIATAATGGVVLGIGLIQKAIGFRWTPPAAVKRLLVAVGGSAVWVRWSW